MTSGLAALTFWTVEEESDASLANLSRSVVMPLSLKVFSNASARPTLYSWSSEMTKAFFGDFAVMRKFAMPGPWSLSFATTRCQYFQPFPARPGLVADGDTLGI